MIVLELLFDLSTGGPHMTLLEALLFVSVNVKIAAHGPSWYAAAAKTKSLEDNEYTNKEIQQTIVGPTTRHRYTSSKRNY